MKQYKIDRGADWKWVNKQMIVGLVTSGQSKADILKLFPYLESEDIGQALSYAAWRVEEIDIPFIHFLTFLKNKA